MPSHRRPQITLAKIMALNGVIAVLLAAYRLGPAGLAPYCLALLWGAIWLLFASLAITPLNAILGIPCPYCQQRTLRRLALPFNFVKYYQCTACRTRCKRTFPLASWSDASGPEDASYYQRKSSSGKWLAYTNPIPPPDDSTCSGILLQSKRLRATHSSGENDTPPAA